MVTPRRSRSHGIARDDKATLGDDVLQVLGRVDVGHYASIIDCHLHDRRSVIAEDRAASDVAPNRHHLGEERPVDEDRIATKAVVGRNDHGGTGPAVSIDKGIVGL